MRVRSSSIDFLLLFHNVGSVLASLFKRGQRERRKIAPSKSFLMILRDDVETLVKYWTEISDSG